jgi:hypothetical protein
MVRKEKERTEKVRTVKGRKGEEGFWRKRTDSKDYVRQKRQ